MTFIDWVMALPEELELQYQDAVHELEEDLKMKVLWLLLGTAFLIHAPELAAQDWKGDVRWAYDDHGAPDCPERYVAFHIEPCLALGNRQ